jgi:hypothetical protein
MIERQAGAQQERGEPVAIDRGTAALAATGASALEVGGTAVAVGKTLVKRILGISEDAAVGTKAADQALRAAAARTIAGGAGRGVAVEMPVEVASSVIERAQAGLPVTGDEAFAEYGEAAYLGGVAGGALGGVGNVSSRGQARRDLAAEEARVGQAQAMGAPLPSAEFAGPPEPPPVQGTLFEGPRQPQAEEAPPADLGAQMFQIREQFDALQRENERLRSQYEQEADPAKKAALFAEAEKLAPQLQAVQAEYDRLKAVTPEEAPGARRPRAPEGQLELPLSDQITERTLAEVGLPAAGGSPRVAGVRGWMQANVLGKTPDEVRALVEQQPDLVKGQGLRARVLRDLTQQQPEAYVEPAVQDTPKPGYVRVYHSGSAGEGDFGRWVSTNKRYASDYRKDLPLFYTDIQADDPRVNNPDYPDTQGIKQGFVFNFELTPQEAATLREIPREPTPDTRAAEQQPLDLGGTQPSVGVPTEPPRVRRRRAPAVEPTAEPTAVEPAGLGATQPPAGERAPAPELQPRPLTRVAEEWAEYKPDNAPAYDQLPLRLQNEWAKRATRPDGRITIEDADQVYADAIQDVGFQAYNFDAERKGAPAEQMFPDTREGRAAQSFYDALPEADKARVTQERDNLKEQERKGGAAVRRQDEVKARKSAEEKEYDEAQKEREREEARRAKQDEQGPKLSRKERRKAKFRVAEEGTKGNPQEVVQKLVDKITAGWKNAPTINVVQSVDNLPEDIAKEAKEAGVNPKGAFSGNTVFVIADNATSYEDVLKTVAHEAIGHYGLRAVLGDKFNPTLDRLYSTNDQIKAKADLKIAQGMPKLTAVEEVLAEASEERIPPKSAMGRAMQTLKNLIRNFFQKMGVKTINDAEIQSLLDNARDYVIENKLPAGELISVKDLPPDGDVRFRVMDVLQKGFSPTPGGTSRQMANSISEGILKLRTQLADKGAFVFDRISKEFNDGVNTALRGAKVEAVYRQGEASGQLLPQFYKLGAIAKEGETKLWEAVKKDGIRPPAEIIDLARKYAKDNDLKFEDAWKQLSDIFQAGREKAFRDHNANRDKGEQAMPRHMEDAEVDRLYPIYESDATVKEIKEVMDASRFDLIDNMVEVGRIPQELADEWKEATNYVPFDRLLEVGTKPRAPQKKVGKGIAQLGRLPELVDAEIVKLPPKNVLENYFGTVGWMVQQVVQEDATLRTLRALEGIKQAKLLTSREFPSNIADRVVKTYIKGEARYFEVDSPYHAVAFRYDMPPTYGLFRVFQKFSQVLRHAITAVPTFTAAQLPQDIHRAIQYSGVQNPASLAAKVLGNFKEFVPFALKGKLGDVAPDLSRFGVTGGVDFDMTDPTQSFLEEMGVKNRTLLKSKTFRNVVNRLEAVALASDFAMRKAIYDQTMEETQGDKLLALTRAREIINFRRFGSGDKLNFIHIATQTVPFYNAYVQGTDVLYRALTGKNAVSGLARNAALKQFWKGAGYLMAASTVYALMMADDEDYENMDLRERDRTWVIGNGIGLPVASELGVLFKAIPERLVEYYRKHGTPDEAVAMEAIIAHFKTGILSEYAGRAIPVPVALKPLLENYANISVLTGRELEGISQKARDPSERVTTRTSELAKSIAKFAADNSGGNVQVSPIMIDNVLQGYLGTTAGLGLALADQLINPDKVRPLHQIVGATAFAYDPVGTRRTTEFYEVREKVVQAQNTLNRLMIDDPERAAAYYERNAERLAVYKMVNSTLEQLERSRAYKNWLDTDAAAETMSGPERLKMKQDVQAYEQKLTEWVRFAKNEMKL